MLTERADRAWFSRLLRHPAMKQSGSILTTPEPTRCPSHKKISNGPHSFTVAGMSTWNSLLASFCNYQLSVTSLHRPLNTELFARGHDHPLALSW